MNAVEDEGARKAIKDTFVSQFGLVSTIRPEQVPEIEDYLEAVLTESPETDEKAPETAAEPSAGDPPPTSDGAAVCVVCQEPADRVDPNDNVTPYCHDHVPF